MKTEPTIPLDKLSGFQHAFLNELGVLMDLYPDATGSYAKDTARKYSLEELRVLIPTLASRLCNIAASKDAEHVASEHNEAVRQLKSIFPQ